IRDGYFDFRRTPPAYALAFQKHDLDVLTLDPKEAAARIVGSAIREQLISSLHHWLFGLPKTERAKHQRLLEVIQLADDDDGRRQIGTESHRGALERLARQPETLAQSPTTLLLLSAYLMRADAQATALDLLLRGQQQHPGDLWLNQDLAEYLM